MGVNIPGIIGIVVFYILILVIGLVAGRKGKRKPKTTSKNESSHQSDDLFLANRGLGLFVASFTSAATMVGGAYINGTAETMGRDGMVWSIAPIAYNLGIVIAAIVYAPKVRRARYTTIFDPMQKKYGSRMGGLLFFPELCGDLFWEAAILAALGSTLSIILDLDTSLSIIISACVAVFYTFFGGLYSVAYTDVIQLFCIAGGLILALPFAATNPNVDFSRIQETWKGQMETNQIEIYIDLFCLCVFGGIPWQAYYQRVLACKSPSLARNASLLGVVISILLAVPPAAIGVIGAAADWNGTDYKGNATLTSTEWSLVLPMVLQYLCPVVVSVIGIGAVSAAVMSSADSIVLGVGSVFARNIYRNIFRLNASDREIVWVLRASIIAVGTLGAVIAITVKSVYGLFILCGDLMFVIQFPQLTCALWVKFSNTYGSASGYIVGLTLRILGGEPILKIPAIMRYPFYDDVQGQLFPFKTFSMIFCFVTIVSISYLTDFLFKEDYISKRFDIFDCFGGKKFENQCVEIENRKFLDMNNVTEDEIEPNDKLLMQKDNGKYL